MLRWNEFSAICWRTGVDELGGLAVLLDEVGGRGPGLYARGHPACAVTITRRGRPQRSAAPTTMSLVKQSSGTTYRSGSPGHCSMFRVSCGTQATSSASIVLYIRLWRWRSRDRHTYTADKPLVAWYGGTSLRLVRARQVPLFPNPSGDAGLDAFIITQQSRTMLADQGFSPAAAQFVLVIRL